MPAGGERATVAPSRREAWTLRLVLLGFGLSGAASLIFEIAWTRTLSTVMGSSTYAMSTVLGAFMGGLAVGALGGARLAPRLKNPAAAFAICELGIGFTGLLINPLIKSLTPLYIASYYAFHQSFMGFSVVQFAIVFAVVGVPTTLMGAGFPVVVRCLTHGARDEEGRLAGRAYGVNTVGAVLGALAAGFLLIPSLGTTRATVLASALNILTALVLLVVQRDRRTLAYSAAGLLLALGASALLKPPQVPFFSYGWAGRFGDEAFARRIAAEVTRAGDQDLVFRREGVEGDVCLTSRDLGGVVERALLNNGKLEGGDSEPFALLAFLPFFTHELVGPVHNALNIGLGSGHTLKMLASLPIDSIVSVELSDGILEANRRHLNPELFDTPRIRHVWADGRNHLLVSRERYDVIIASPSWATEPASAGLLTDEFFALAASRLHHTGVFAVWVDFSMMATDDMSVLLRTFAKNFKHVSAWKVEGEEVILVGANMASFPDEAQVTQRLERARPAMHGRFSIALADSTPRPASFEDINTDDRPVLEFHNAQRFIVGPPEPETAVR